MNHADTAKLCRIIAGIVPQQSFEPETPAFWQPILADVRIEDAMEALQSLGGKVRYIAPIDIIETVRSIRAERVELHTDSEIMDDVDPNIPGRQYVEILRARVKLIADGRPIESARQAVTGPRNPRYAVTDGTGRA